MTRRCQCPGTAASATSRGRRRRRLRRRGARRGSPRQHRHEHHHLHASLRRQPRRIERERAPQRGHVRLLPRRPAQHLSRGPGPPPRCEGHLQGHLQLLLPAWPAGAAFPLGRAIRARWARRGDRPKRPTREATGTHWDRVVTRTLACVPMPWPIPCPIGAEILAFACDGRAHGGRVRRHGDVRGSRVCAKFRVHGPTGQREGAPSSARSLGGRRLRPRAEPLPARTRRGQPRRADVLDAYVRMGSALAVAGKTRLALIALKQAALLDPVFTVPPEAGKKADGGRRQGAQGAAARGRARHHRAGPGRGAGRSHVRSRRHARPQSRRHRRLGGPHRARLARVAHLPASSSPPEVSVHFDVPRRMTLPDASLLVRVQRRSTPTTTSSSRPRSTCTSPGRSSRLRRPWPRSAPSGRRTGRTTSRRGGFWTTAWPYVLGGAALAAGGAAVYFATRPTDESTSEPRSVELVH